MLNYLAQYNVHHGSGANTYNAVWCVIHACCSVANH